MPHKNLQERNEYHHEYHAKNRVERNATRKARHAENKERHTEYCKRYREENAEKVRTIKKLGYVKRRDTFQGRALILWRSARARAKQRNEIFTLTLNHVVKGMQQPCPYTGVFFDLKTLERANPYAPSVDRKDCTRPYSNENVQIVCWAYNRMKSDMSESELLFFCKLIVKQAETQP
jgi:hypothetical protein